MTLRVVVVTGIYPPDIGGPATHASGLAGELRSRGHAVTVLTLTDGGAAAADGLVAFPRRRPWVLRAAAVASWLVRHRHEYDAVYATGLQAEAVLGARLAGRPVVAKQVCDPAWERAVRRGWTELDFDAFQATAAGPLRVRAMRRVRTSAARHADAVTAPSARLAAAVDGWTRRPGTTRVVPNASPMPAAVPGPRRPGPLRAVFVGRLVPVKAVDVLIEAMAATPGVTLDVVGGGPERAALERLAVSCGVGDRVRFAGPVPHGEVRDRLTAADVLVSAARFEGLPHAAVEAITCATPVLATAAGGTAEVVEDGVNGLLLRPGTPGQFAGALARLRDDEALRTALARGAAAAAPAWGLAAGADRIVSLLEEAVAARRRPRAVFVGRSPLALPALERRMAVLGPLLDVGLVAPGPAGWRRVAGADVAGVPPLRPWLVGTAAFHLLGPALAVAAAAGRRPSAVVCQSPLDGAAALVLRRLVPRRLRPRVVVEVHGDWRTAARAYGGPARRPLGPASDAVAAWAVRRADRVRAVGPFTCGLVAATGRRGPVDAHVALSDYEAFLVPSVPPPPGPPVAAFVGVLERYKAPEVLLEAWPLVVAEVPAARLVLAGEGPSRPSLERQVRRLGIEGSVELAGRLAVPEVVALLDGARCLVLPSVSEGHPRVAVEAMARARAVVGARTGGIPEVVEDGATGLLVPPADPPALAAALVRVLGDRPLATELGAAGRRRVEDRDPLEEFRAGSGRLAAWIAASGAGAAAAAGAVGR